MRCWLHAYIDVCVEKRSEMLGDLNVCGPHASAPLVSLIVLTCNRPAFLRLAISAAASQNYPQLEAVIVDDGSTPVDQSSLHTLAVPGKLRLLIVRTRRTSIGAKRNAALRASNGTVLAHWDDDDLHPPDQVSSLVCPIVRNETDMSCATFSHFAAVSASSVIFFQPQKPPGPCFLGSLAFRRSVAIDLWDSGESQVPSAQPLSSGRLAPFADVSLSEDLYFAERALARCVRMLPVSDVAIVYVRHQASGVSNTWRPPSLVLLEGGRAPADRSVTPPAYVDGPMRARLVEAERTSGSMSGSCLAVRRYEPKGMRAGGMGLRVPNMPSRCCKGLGRRMRRPSPDPDDSFCGASKGVCTATCTCAGEQTHGKAALGVPPAPLPCGLLCCSYWHGFWKTHPQNCTSGAMRPLKRHYCGRLLHRRAGTRTA